jgi:hypothetical protein
MTHFNGASTILLSSFFSKTALHVLALAQKPSGKNIDFRGDLDLVTVACLRTHSFDFLPHRSPDKRASECTPFMMR